MMNDAKYCKDCKNINCPEGRVNCKYPDAIACDLYHDTPLTLFEYFQASPEAMAGTLVYKLLGMGSLRRSYICWKSTIIDGTEFSTRDEAIAATLAKLKEVYNVNAPTESDGAE